MKVFVNSSFLGMLRHSKTINVVSSRSIKNFGHKRQPVPIITTLWHGFLTFTFIGLVLEWKKIKMLIFGDAFDTPMLQESVESNDNLK
ncbi:unnamed protein product [Arctia plantaginis]|uniref:Transmembrane protein n=1 Tax=Arctia plantaginis TaxID=874455 RepID=A0A8S1B1K5_ARCPL|nr:unnamed protein product [Arctia plantaginis]